MGRAMQPTEMQASVAPAEAQSSHRPSSTRERTIVPRLSSMVRLWWHGESVREVRRLLRLPAPTRSWMLWPALLNLGVFAPTDIVANDPLIGGSTPGSPRQMAFNPLLSDPIDAFIPWRLFARSELDQGLLPLWNPYNLLGTHLEGNLQSQTFSLFNLLWLLFPPIWGLGAVAFIKW